MKSILQNIKGDRVIWAIAVILAIVSTLAIYSSISTLAYKSGGGNQEIILFKHLITVGVGFALMFFVHKLKYNYYSKISQLAFYIALPLLALTLVMGTNLNDASRWLVVPGLGISFQTSDLGKIALIAYLARILAKRQDTIEDLKEGFFPIIWPIGLVCVLILPANFSTAAVLFMVCFVLMFVGRVSLKYLGAMVGAGVFAFAILILLAYKAPNVLPRLETWKNRIENFKNGENQENYQVNQAKIAIATGGVIGKGPGKSTQRNFLPHPYSDFIYAFIIEEYGMIGGIGIVFLYMLLLYRVIIIVNKTDDTFGALLALGCGLLLVSQALINMAVSVNLMPVTGQPLPFVSKGGTSVVFTGIALGMILSVSKELSQDHDVAKESKKEKGGELATA